MASPCTAQRNCPTFPKKVDPPPQNDIAIRMRNPEALPMHTRGFITNVLLSIEIAVSHRENHSVFFKYCLHYIGYWMTIDIVMRQFRTRSVHLTLYVIEMVSFSIHYSVHNVIVRFV